MWYSTDLVHHKTIENVGDYSGLLTLLSNYDWVHDKYDTAITGTKQTTGIWFPLLIKRDPSIEEAAIIKSCDPLMSEISSLFPYHVFVKAELYCIHGDTIQDTHVDPRIFHRFSHRVHIPLIVTDKSYLKINDNLYHLEPFNIYTFNNVAPHCSMNLGIGRRIHLVVDIMPSLWFSRLRGANISIWDLESRPIQDLESYFTELKTLPKTH